MPKYRTGKYTVYRACERFGILPPNVKPKWTDNDVWTQAELLAYGQIREMEDAQAAMPFMGL